MTPASLAAPFTAPVSRQLAVAELQRAVAFYRDRLGFTTRAREGGNPDQGVTMERGSARIDLEVGDGAWDSTGRRNPRGQAIVYLPVDHVGALRDELVARGTPVSPICAVNHLKLNACTVTDPDGHLLCFATTYHEDSSAPPVPLVEKIMPSFPCNDVPAAVAHYRDVLGFSVNYAQHDIGVMDRDAARILLIARTPEMTGTSACYLYVRDADQLHAQLTERGAHVEGAPVSQAWGLREFHVRDVDGNRLTFGEPFE
jgi:catechol 2,3-dioxygenase-like lactoylglutathione lyase family enzyme